LVSEGLSEGELGALRRLAKASGLADGELAQLVESAEAALASP
jgi:hypothetical protein